MQFLSVSLTHALVQEIEFCDDSDLSEEEPRQRTLRSCQLVTATALELFDDDAIPRFDEREE